MTFGSSFSQKGSLYPHTVMYFMGLGHNDPWVEFTHVTSTDVGQRSSRGQLTFGSSFFWQKRSLYPHT